MRIRNVRYFKVKQLKYKNISCTCRQNHRHDSIKEAHYCDQLELLRQRGEIKSYEIQRTFDLKVKKQKISSLRVDFLVTDKYGGKEIHEVKSAITMTYAWNIKRKLFEALYPKIPYIVIK